MGGGWIYVVKMQVASNTQVMACVCEVKSSASRLSQQGKSDELLLPRAGISRETFFYLLGNEVHTLSCSEME